MVAYRIKSEGNNVFTVEPKGFWSFMSYRDLVHALTQLSNSYRIVSVTRYFDWWATRYLVVVEER